MPARMKRILVGTGAGCLMLLALVLAANAQSLKFPELSGRVVDQANILDASTKTALTEKLRALEERTTNQLVVVTLASLQGTSIEDYGYQLGRQWRIGQKDKNNGALLIVAPNERKVRIEVGYGVEGSLTDAVTKLIIENSILPRFRANDFVGGITRGTDDILAVLSGQADEYKQRAAKRPDNAAPGLSLGTILLLAFIAFLVLRAVSRNAFGSRRRRGGLWGSAAGPIFIPGSGSGWGSGSGSGWDSGSSGDFSGGGGGSFGGGGSSGSW
jgi:uncharacterized protein